MHAEGVSSLEARCAGVKKGFPNTENIQVNGSDLAAATSTLQAKLAQDKSITDIVTLDAGVARRHAGEAGRGQPGQDRHLRPEPGGGKAIQDKTIEFCIDQQPYLQGYLAVDALWLNLTNGNDIGGGKAVLTGPSFVDSSNIDKIAGFAANNAGDAGGCGRHRPHPTTPKPISSTIPRT